MSKNITLSVDHVNIYDWDVEIIDPSITPEHLAYLIGNDNGKIIKEYDAQKGHDVIYLAKIEPSMNPHTLDPTEVVSKGKPIAYVHNISPSASGTEWKNVEIYP